MVALYLSYVDFGLKLPHSSFLSDVVRFCKESFSQIPTITLDRLLTFALLCLKCGIEASLPVFHIWFQIMCMPSVPRRMLISQRTWFALLEHMSDRSHN